jgi:hypothetical protein
VAQWAVEQLALVVVCREPSAWHVGVSLGVGRAGVQGSATCHGPGGGVLCTGWATTSHDVVGRGGLFCVGGSFVVGGLEPSG